MRSEVGSLRVVCRAPREGEERALRLRRRLESTARVHLPAALEGALVAERRHVFAERIEVRLDFEPDDYDDVTLAALWAARVAEAVGSAGPEDGVVVHESERDLYRAAAAQWADGGGLEPVFEPLGCGTGARVPALPLLGAFDSRERLAGLAAALVESPGRLTRVRSRLAPAERELVMSALAGRRRWGHWGSGAWAAAGGGDAVLGSGARPARAASGGARAGETDGAHARRGEPGEAAAASRDQAASAWSQAWERCARDRAAGVRFGSAPAPSGAGESPDRRAPEVERVARTTPPGERGEARAGARRGRRAGRHDPGPRRESAAAPLAWLSRCAGLVLLYPWLEAHLSAALPQAEAPPGAPPEVGPRLWALAALAQAEPVADTVLDPLVLALAGDEPGRDLGAWRPVPPDHLEALCEPAGGVLAAFAGALPGFAGSSPDYVRREFLGRHGAIEPDGDALAVVLEPAPLDLMLDRLPYPLAPFTLPWSRAIAPTLRSSRA